MSDRYKHEAEGYRMIFQAQCDRIAALEAALDAALLGWGNLDMLGVDVERRRPLLAVLGGASRPSVSVASRAPTGGGDEATPESNAPQVEPEHGAEGEVGASGQVIDEAHAASIEAADQTRKQNRPCPSEAGPVGGCRNCASPEYCPHPCARERRTNDALPPDVTRALVEQVGYIVEAPRTETALPWPEARYTRNQSEVVERVCKLLSRVWNHFQPGAETPNDCFCVKQRDFVREDFRHGQQSIAWLEALVDRELGVARETGGTGT